jgi:hypothetical protein
MFGFIRSKHRRMMAVRSLDTQDEPFNLSDDDDGDNDENNHHDDYAPNYKTETTTANNSAHEDDNDDSYLSPDDEEDDDVENKVPNGTPVATRTTNATNLMQLKPTGSTSIGPHQDMIDYFQSESNDVENSQIYFDDNGVPVNGDVHAQFPKMDHRFHANSMDYSRTNSTRNRPGRFSGDDTSNTMAAANPTRMGPSGGVGVGAGGFGIKTQGDDDDDTCSKTLNTNLEGMHYLQEDHHHPAAQNHHHPEHSMHQRSHRRHRMVDHEENIEETPYYYDDDGPVDEYGQPYHHDDLVDEYGQPYPPEEYYYEEEDHHHHHGGQQQPMYDEDGRPYYDDGNGMFDAQGQPYFNATGPFFPEHDPYYDDNNTLANSTIATEGFDPPLVERTSWTQPVVKLPSHYDKKHTATVETFGSVESASSSDDETRDMSILDEEEEENSDDDDDDDDSESDSEDEARSRRSRHSGKKNPRKSKKTMRKMIGGMKHCSLKGSSVSYDDDESDDDEATGVTSKMTDSSRSKRSNGVGSRRSNGSQRDRKSDRKARRNKTSHIDLLFNKASALGQELLEGVADELAPRKRKGKKSSRSRRSRRNDDEDDDEDDEDDPATRIVASLRDMFSCGGNSRDYRY